MPAVFFHEITVSKEYAEAVGNNAKIRNGIPELRVRIANYMFGASPQHMAMHAIIDMCEKRSVLVPREEYDVLYITGPDVVTEVVTTLLAATQRGGVEVVPREIRTGPAMGLLHKGHGSWRWQTNPQAAGAPAAQASAQPVLATHFFYPVSTVTIVGSILSFLTTVAIIIGLVLCCRAAMANKQTG